MPLSKFFQRICPICKEPLLSWSELDNMWICEACDHEENDDEPEV